MQNVVGPGENDDIDSDSDDD